jgi:hypothetical protein
VLIINRLSISRSIDSRQVARSQKEREREKRDWAEDWIKGGVTLVDFQVKPSGRRQKGDGGDHCVIVVCLRFERFHIWVDGRL